MLKKLNTLRVKKTNRSIRHSAVKILCTGGGNPDNLVVTDFMLGPGMMGGSTRIDDWR